MDWLDRIPIWAIVLIIIASFALIAGHVGEAKPKRPLQQRTSATEHKTGNPDIDAKVRLIRNLMESNNLVKAETMARELLQQFPYESELHMTLGDIFMRKQAPVKAILEYKEAVDLNPDYLDKKTPFFQGKKLKTAAGEALIEIENKIKLNPGDESVKLERKNIYYLQRRIAGSCS